MRVCGNPNRARKEASRAIVACGNASLRVRFGGKVSFQFCTRAKNLKSGCNNRGGPGRKIARCGFTPRTYVLGLACCVLNSGKQNSGWLCKSRCVLYCKHQTSIFPNRDRKEASQQASSSNGTLPYGRGSVGEYVSGTKQHDQTT